MPLVTDTVAIPVVRGINVTTPARLLEPMELLEAENVRFPLGAGAKKRRGHAGSRLRGAKPLPVGEVPPDFDAPLRPETYFTGDRELPSAWVFGYGYLSAATREDVTEPLETSPYPESGLVFGCATRDRETLVWDGSRLLSRTTSEIPGGRCAESNAVMPSLRSEVIAKASVAQQRPDCADNGVILVAAWVSDGAAYYSAIDSSLGTTLVPATQLDVETPGVLRCTPVGAFVHITVADSATGTLINFAVHQDYPDEPEKDSFGDCNGYFDTWKHSESQWLVVLSQTTQFTVRWLDASGSIDSYWVPDVSTVSATTSVGICATANRIGLVWRDGTAVEGRVYEYDGTADGSVKSLGTTGSQVRPVTICPKWLADGSGNAAFNAYWDSYESSTSTLYISRFSPADAHYSTHIYHATLASSAFRVGDRTFIWAGHRSTYQSTWFLLDESLRPVGHLDYVTANVPSATDDFALASVNWYGTAPDKDRCVFHCALGFRVRVAVTPATLGTNAPVVYSEPSIHFVKMDFLPRLRSAQAGRCTYFAGAQLWSYDGTELVEAGFHLAPEVSSVTPASGGSLTATGEYIWRVDLCYRNAQNEEVRSASFFTAQTTLAGAEAQVILTIPTVLTRREGSYFLIFRNEDAGTLWYLVNSRDPTSADFVENDQNAATVTFTDDTSDAAILASEQHPGETIEYLDHFSAPACEVIAAGRDRLWVSGGEIPAGQVYPSRLFEPGETPSFNGNLAVQVDRSAEPITALGFIGEHTIIFRTSHAYVIDGEGPDNVRQGSFYTPRGPLTDIGAVGPEAVALVSGGLTFQSPAGLRIYGPGGQVVPFGRPVDAETKDANIVAAVVVPGDQEVRFYTWDGPTYVFNYQYNAWSTWTIAAAGAVKNSDTSLALVATPTGVMLEETEGLWRDSSAPYRMRVRFPWMRAGQLMDFQRVRRIGGLGAYEDDHSIHVDVYYNERDFPEEQFDWDIPDTDSMNTDTFGSESFGDGNLGDTAAVEGIEFRDSTWPWRRRLHRQKCSVVSVAVDDNYTDGEGFTLTALALELAKKPGLDRSPWRGGTYTNTSGSGSIDSGV
jgi:hypothetical protein